MNEMRSLLFIAVAALALTAAFAEKKIVCYFGSWAAQRPGSGKFDISHIDPKLCTHLIYSFVGLAGDNITVLNAPLDLPDNSGKNGFGRFTALRNQSPGTKILVAIGGWEEGSTEYSRMVSSAATRQRFVANAVAFVKNHNFDGLDFDWEYPSLRGGVKEDVNNFVALLKELRQAFDREGLILSAAVGASFKSAASYNIPEISKYLHFVNLMTYDLHGSWDKQTGLNAPLYPSRSETGNERLRNVDACVEYWLDQGTPPEKLIVGTATYGRSFTLANPKAAHVGAPTSKAGAAGPLTREAGMLGYNEICELQQKERWPIKFDVERRVPFTFHGDQWIGYDNVKSMREKAEYIKRRGLGGAMVWSIDTDDFRGVCGEKYPLIGTLNQVLRNRRPVSG